MKKIFHISDIHIRNGDKITSRYNEYNNVFDNLFKSLHNNITKYNLSYNDYIIIVTGDIFHNKNIIGNYGLELYNKFIKGLTDIGKTIIFHGNHDRNQNEIDQPSLISSTIEIENLRILKSTQTFIINNIGFSYVNIDDTLDNTSTVGRLKKLPEFPKICEKVSKKIALFHGTFANVKLYNGNHVLNSTNPYPFEWISDFDFALLGDIHLRQKGMYGNMLWGYAGSLVQQNYGEDIINHGYMIWDIELSTIEYVNVYNSHGYINIIAKDDKIYIRKRGKYDTLLEDVITNDYFPKSIEWRCYAELSLENSEKLYYLLNLHGIKHNSKLSKIVKKSLQETKNTLHVNTETFIEYLHNIIPEKYYNKAVEIIKNNEILLFDTNCPEELIDECNKKNKDISHLIKTYHNNTKINGEKNARHPFCIEYLEWDNLFCYESGNSINFAHAINNTLLICGNNGTGKSAIYDIITLAIWGMVTKDKQSQLSKTSIINYKHNKATTSIDILINDSKYNIRRTFNTGGKNNIEIYKYSINYDKTLIGKNNACTEFIKDNIGTLDEFLTCSMITQVVDNDILRMDYKDCTAIIDKASNINEIYELFNFLKLSLNKYKDYKKTIESKRDVYKHIISNTKIDINANNDLSEKLTKYQETYDDLMRQNNKINIDLYNDNYKELLNNTYNYMELLDEKYYNDICEELLKLKQHFVNINYNDIVKYAKQYKQCSKDSIIPEYYEKPCDYDYILAETKYIENYKLPAKLNLSIEELQNKLKDIDNNIKDLHNMGTKKIDEPVYDIKEILSNINLVFKTDNPIDSLIAYVNNNKCITNNKLSNIISYECYLKLVELNDKLNIELDNFNDIYIENNRKLQELYSKKQDIISVQKPDKEYNENIELTDNIENLENLIKTNEDILNNCYSKLDEIDELNSKVSILETELNELKTNKDNEYDPKCKFCCKRPWVIRMQTLNKEIIVIKDKITLLHDNVYINTSYDYIKLYNDNMQYKMIIENTKLYNAWLIYNDYHTIITKLNNEIDNIINTIENNNEKKSNNLQLLDSIKNDINNFNSNVNILHNAYINYEEYSKYIETFKTLEHLNNQKHIYSSNIEFKKFIEPKIIKLNELKIAYDKWTNYNVVKAHRYIELENIIENEKKKIKNNNNIIVVDKLIAKTELVNKIEICNNNIKTTTEELAKIKAQNNYNIKNQDNYNYYTKELDKINDIITILDIIISNFKDYRINLYKNHILKALIDNTNNYIKDLCHENTKKFKLDYLINDTKDIIHINWLINNVTDDNIQQTISINQASGFQRFVISLALRMSLYSNTKCDQLFIDEGFTACDKQNLSLVPEFLKNLLNTFSGVIIMSHIDIIKDSMDIVANIEYNKNNKTSYINYNI